MPDFDWNEILDPIISAHGFTPHEVARFLPAFVHVYQLGIQQGKFAQALDSDDTGK